MERRLAWAAAILAAAGLACGSSSSSSKSQSDTPGGGGGPGCDRVTLRFRGANGGAYSAVRVEVGSVTAAAAATLPVESVPTAPVDLVANDADRLGVLTPPAGATAVGVSFPIVSGEATGTGAHGAIQVCTAPIAFTFDPTRVRPADCHVVVELDLARSVLATADGAVLLPTFKVRY